MGRVGAYPGAQHGCDSWLERMPTAGYSRSAISCRLHLPPRPRQTNVYSGRRLATSW